LSDAFRVCTPLNPRVVETDRVFCALAVRAATTQRAVVTLAEAGDGDNAMALSRVLTENACLMQWLLGGPGRGRLETYIVFLSVLHTRTVDLPDKYFSRPSPRISAAAAVARGPVPTKGAQASRTCCEQRATSSIATPGSQHVKSD
jgi:hypothetical protein